MMNMKTPQLILALALVASLKVAPSVAAKETLKFNPQTETLKNIAPPELPLKCAGLVSKAEAADRDSTTISVVQAAVEINPPAAAAVVGAIARTSPALAPVAAATAASRQPRLASAIAKAAASAAPSQAAKIVAAVCRETPAQYLAVATAVAKAVPAASKEIIWAVSSALPSMKPYIDQVMALSTATSPSVATVLNQASKFAEASPSATTPQFSQVMSPQPPPRPGPPFVPLPSTPSELNPSSSGEVPPGGRDYARP